MKIQKFAFTVVWLAASVAAAFGQTHSAMPPGMTHEEHLKQMKKEEELKKHGAAAMGFDQDATIHHFKLLKDGGTIEVLVRDSTDNDNLRRVREHLKGIAQDFAMGVFEKPEETHQEVPPGVETMQSLKTMISYKFQSSSKGGTVRIQTKDKRAQAAIHDFLRYQIKEHATGDPTKVQP
jgi:hypothetical protein